MTAPAPGFSTPIMSVDLLHGERGGAGLRDRLDLHPGGAGRVDGHGASGLQDADAVGPGERAAGLADLEDGGLEAAVAHDERRAPPLGRDGHGGGADGEGLAHQASPPMSACSAARIMSASSLAFGSPSAASVSADSVMGWPLAVDSSSVTPDLPTERTVATTWRSTVSPSEGSWPSTWRALAGTLTMQRLPAAGFLAEAPEGAMPIRRARPSAAWDSGDLGMLGFIIFRGKGSPGPPGWTAPGIGSGGAELRLGLERDAELRVQHGAAPVRLPADGHVLRQRVEAVGLVVDDDGRLERRTAQAGHLRHAVGLRGQAVGREHGVGVRVVGRVGAFGGAFDERIRVGHQAHAMEVADLVVEELIGVLVADHVLPLGVIADVALDLRRHHEHEGLALDRDGLVHAELRRGVQDVLRGDAGRGGGTGLEGRERREAAGVALVKAGRELVADDAVGVERALLAHQEDGGVHVVQEADVVDDVGDLGHLAALRERDLDGLVGDIARDGRRDAFGEGDRGAWAGEVSLFAAEEADGAAADVARQVAVAGELVEDQGVLGGGEQLLLEVRAELRLDEGSIERHDVLRDEGGRKDGLRIAEYGRARRVRLRPR